MEFHQTVVDLSPAQLYGLMVSAIGVFWVVSQVGRIYPEMDGRARVVFWAGMVALVGVPVYLGITALAPSLPNP